MYEKYFSLTTKSQASEEAKNSSTLSSERSGIT